jgi:prepilin-type N-terminal cleavage/methylation domain-containing protein
VSIVRTERLGKLKRNISSRRGVSLVEVLVAAVIFAIVSLAVVEFFYLGRAYIREMGLRRTALALTQQKLEQLRGTAFEAADLSIGSHGPETVAMGENLSGARTWSVTWRDDTANGYSGTDQDYKEVTVRVVWSWEHVSGDTVSLDGWFYP